MNSFIKFTCRVKKRSLVFDTPQVFIFLKVDSDAALLPVDLTGNVNMIEKLVSGGTGTGDLQILSPTG